MRTISDIARVHLHWSLTDGIGPRTFGKLLIHLGDPAAALGAPASTLETIRGIGRETAEKVVRSRDAADVEAEIAAAAEHRVRIICRQDAEYPEILKEIAEPPIVLYLKGELRPTDAVLGLRRQVRTVFRCCHDGGVAQAATTRPLRRLGGACRGA